MWALDDGDVKIAVGGAVEQLRLMPAQSVQCVVTSPPFWSLRDYDTGAWVGGSAGCDHESAKRRAVGNNPSTKSTLTTNNGRGPKSGDKYAADGGSMVVAVPVCEACGARWVDEQIGMEATPEAWAVRLVEVFREVRRVLRDDGVMWVEIGDSHAAKSKGTGGTAASTLGAASGGNAMSSEALQRGLESKQFEPRAFDLAAGGLKAKDLVGQPWLLAFALRADGWYLRQEVVIDKPNAMPESAKDRPSTAHSRVFLLTKKPRYYYDYYALLEPHAPDGRKQTRVKQGAASIQHRDGERWPGPGRNARSVWRIPTASFEGAHFATFPEDLVERCILAGSSERGACAACGAPWHRLVVEVEVEGASQKKADGWDTGAGGHGAYHRQGREAGAPGQPVKAFETVGWERRCRCPAGTATVPCVVLDPFMGAATTAIVARRLGRYAVGVELNPKYVHEIARRRLEQLSLLAPDAT